MEKQLILSRAEAAGVALTDIQAQAFCTYHDMITETNKKFNLTRVSDDPLEAVDRNYLDSIAPIALHVFDGAHEIADVGSGAGFPGIPLAIALPDVHFVLLDSLNKRVVFLNEVIDALHLNAEAVHIRAEDAAKLKTYARRFDCAVARAVAPMKLLAKYLPPLVRPGGQMIAYKGPSVAEELTEAAPVLKKYAAGETKLIDVPIPGRDWTHRLAITKIR